jgi:hypothetical protein
MFTKKKVIARGSYTITKIVIDWEAVGGAIVVGVIILLLL